jgi:hypothetical protein
VFGNEQHYEESARYALQPGVAAPQRFSSAPSARGGIFRRFAPSILQGLPGTTNNVSPISVEQIQISGATLHVLFGEFSRSFREISKCLIKPCKMSMRSEKPFVSRISLHHTTPVHYARESPFLNFMTCNILW